MEYKGFSGVFYQIAVWIMRFTTTNLLWFLFNLPIAYLALNLLLVKNVDELISLVTIIIFLTPFVFFPATTAMFGIARKWVTNQDIKLLSSFWKYYKENYIRSMTGGMILVLIWVMVFINYYLFLNSNLNSLFSWFFFGLAFLLTICTLHFFSITVHMKIRLFRSLRNSFFITVGNPLLSLQIGIMTGAIIYLSFNIITFLIPFFMGSLIAYLSFASFYKYFTRLQAEAE